MSNRVFASWVPWAVLVPFGLVSGLVLACAKPLPTRTPVSVSPLSFGSGEWRMPDQVMVVTDASGTMYRAQTFPDAKALTQSFIGVMPDARARSRSGAGYSAGLVGFGGEERMTHPLSPFDRNGMAATAQGLSIMGDIDGMGGETPFRNVFREIGESLKGAQGPAAVVMFTDGRADQPDRAVAAARKLVEGYGGGVCFHGVHVGTDPDGRDFLSRLAGLTSCGSVTDGSGLNSASAFQSFARGVFTGRAPEQTRPAPRGDVRERIVLRGVNFDFDKADIRGDAAVILDEAASILNRNRGFTVHVEGHTDATGPAAYNQGLSERRAAAVKRYLVGRGVTGARLQTVGFGESQPLAANNTRDGRQLNRRVELKVLE